MKSKKDKRKKNEKNNSKSKSAAVLERDASTEIKPREPSFELDYPSFLYPSTLCENRTDITHELIDTKDIRYVVYNDEAQLGDIQRMAEKDLAEPYSVFTYRYFLNNWPELCLCAYIDSDEPCSTEHGKMVGTILCKIDLETNDDETIKKGYIGMLIVDSTLRNRGIGLKLSMMGIEKMIALGCESIVLETEVWKTCHGI